MSLIHGLHFRNIHGDLYGGIVSAVIALPLALAFGVASGAGAIAGLYGAIFVGFLAALFGGTPAQASGPTGPMTIVFAGAFAQFAQEPALAFTAVLIGGFIQILFGVFQVGHYITLVPYPVISGFMSGIGCIILLLQIGPLLGHAAESTVLENIKAIPYFLQSPHLPAVGIATLTVGIVYLTPSRIGKFIPPALLALLTGSLVAFFFLPTVPVIGEVPQGLPAFTLPPIQFDMMVIVIETACVLAVLGSIDSLLTSLVCDNMTRTQHNSNRELIGQGIGNMVSSLFGGLPGAGATVRSVANIRSGGRTPLSGSLMAVILFFTLIWLAPFAEKIPLAVLAGILLKVGIDIIDWRLLRHVVEAPRADVLIMAIVLLVTVFVDLITAVGVGVVLASLLFVKEMADLELANMRIITGSSHEAPLTREENSILDQHKGQLVLIHVDGPMSFGSAKNMVRQLEGITEFSLFTAVVLDLSDVPAIDGTAALAVEDMLRIVKSHKQHLFFVGMQPAVKNVLDGLGVLKLIRPGHQFAFRLDALKQAASLVGSSVSEPQSQV